PPQRLLNGLARLAFEIGGSKADGGESRLSGTSLNDMRSNVEGIELAYRVIFSRAIEAGSPRLAEAAQAVIRRLKTDVQIPALLDRDGGKRRAKSKNRVAVRQAPPREWGPTKPALEDAAVQWRDGDVTVAPVPRE